MINDPVGLICLIYGGTFLGIGLAVLLGIAYDRRKGSSHDDALWTRRSHNAGHPVAAGNDVEPRLPGGAAAVVGVVMVESAVADAFAAELAAEWEAMLGGGGRAQGDHPRPQPGRNRSDAPALRLTWSGRLRRALSIAIAAGRYSWRDSR